MDMLFETLNRAGLKFVEFALPMLIQSSLLILILLAADMLLKKKVRAVFRYWIWMLVLIKLLLPVSLYSPMSIGSWFGEKIEYNKPQEDTGRNVATTEQIQNVKPVNREVRSIQPRRESMTIVTSEPRSVMTNPVVKPVDPVTREPASVRVTKISWQAILFVIWLAISAALGIVLVKRTVYIQKIITRSSAIGLHLKKSASPTQVLKHCCIYLDMPKTIPLKISPDATSPVVCGLFRPVILLPQNLISSLSPNQLKAIFFHELAHVKRGDLWVNLIQTFLQIIYFYNPLLWLANTIIRRTREQAVDEMVLVVMGKEAGEYPETLLNVAKLAFKRPALSLRLIGVVENEDALTGRIKHILNRPIPKSAKLGLLGLILIITAAVILLPMSKGVNVNPVGISDYINVTDSSGQLTIKSIDMPEPVGKGIKNPNVTTLSVEVENRSSNEMYLGLEYYEDAGKTTFFSPGAAQKADIQKVPANWSGTMTFDIKYIRFIKGGYLKFKFAKCSSLKDYYIQNNIAFLPVENTEVLFEKKYVIVPQKNNSYSVLISTLLDDSSNERGTIAREFLERIKKEGISNSSANKVLDAITSRIKRHNKIEDKERDLAAYPNVYWEEISLACELIVNQKGNQDKAIEFIKALEFVQCDYGKEPGIDLSLNGEMLMPRKDIVINYKLVLNRVDGKRISREICNTFPVHEAATIHWGRDILLENYKPEESMEVKLQAVWYQVPESSLENLPDTRKERDNAIRKLVEDSRAKKLYDYSQTLELTEGSDWKGIFNQVTSNNNNVSVFLGGEKPLGLYFGNNTLWFEVENNSENTIEINTEPHAQKGTENAKYGYLEIVDIDGKEAEYKSGWHEEKYLWNVKPGETHKVRSFANGNPLRGNGPGTYKARVTLVVRDVETDHTFEIKSNWHEFEVTPCGYPKDFVPEKPYDELRMAQAHQFMVGVGHATKEQVIGMYEKIIEKYPDSKYELHSHFGIAKTASENRAPDLVTESDYAMSRKHYREIIKKWPDVVTTETIHARYQGYFRTADFRQSRVELYKWMTSLTTEQMRNSLVNYSFMLIEPTEDTIQRAIESLENNVSGRIKTLERDLKRTGNSILKESFEFQGAPIIGYDVKLNFADPTIKDDSFHSQQSVAFVLSFQQIEGMLAGKGIDFILTGQKSWPVMAYQNSITISDGEIGNDIISESWSSEDKKFEKVVTLPLEYSGKNYQCPVYIELQPRERDFPTGSYWFCAYISGRLPSGSSGRTFEIVNLDQQMEFRLNGDGTDKRDAVLGIDINGDGKINPSATGGEQFSLYEPFTIDSKTYRVTEVDSYLPRVVFREVASESESIEESEFSENLKVNSDKTRVNFPDTAAEIEAAARERGEDVSNSIQYIRNYGNIRTPFEQFAIDKTQFNREFYNNSKEGFEELIRTPNITTVYAQRWLIILDWLAEKIDAQVAAEKLMNLSKTLEDEYQQNFTKAIAMIILGRDYEMAKAVELFRECKPEMTPQWGYFLFDLHRNFNNYVESRESEIDPLNGQIALNREQRIELEKTFRDALTEYADYLEYDLLPAAAGYVTSKNADLYRSIEKVNIVDSLRQLTIGHTRCLLFGPTTDQIVERLQSKILPDVLAVWQKSLVLLKDKNAIEAHEKEIANRAKNLRISIASLPERFEKVIEFTIDKVLDDNESPWGQEIEEIQIRGRIDGQWHDGEIPKFLVDVRNDGPEDLRLILAPEWWELELDGVWYKIGAWYSGIASIKSLGSGEQKNGIEFVPAESWEWQNNRSPLKFTEGTHEVRLSLNVFRKDPNDRHTTRVLTNPIKLEILPELKKTEVETNTNKLDFRIIPEGIGSSGHPIGITPQEVGQYLLALEQNGPNAKLPSNDYAWLEFDENLESNLFIKQKYQDKMYVLASNKKTEVMLDDGSWYINFIDRQRGNEFATRYDSVIARFDEYGDHLFTTFTNNNMGKYLAIVGSGKVIYVSRISRIMHEATITGDFSESQAGLWMVKFDQYFKAQSERKQGNINTEVVNDSDREQIENIIESLWKAVDTDNAKVISKLYYPELIEVVDYNFPGMLQRFANDKQRLDPQGNDIAKIASLEICDNKAIARTKIRDTSFIYYFVRSDDKWYLYYYSGPTSMYSTKSDFDFINDWPQTQLDNEAFGAYLEASNLLHEGAERAEMAERFSSIGKLYPFTPRGSISSELGILFNKMVQEDESFVEPSNIDELSTQEKIDYYIYKLRDVAEQEFLIPGKCYVLEMPRTPDSAAVALNNMGPVVIPAMISLLEDQRPTRSVGLSMNGGAVLRYCDIALEIIESVTEKKFDFRSGRGSYLSTASEELRDKIVEDVESWWEQNKDSLSVLSFSSQLKKAWQLKAYEGIDEHTGKINIYFDIKYAGIPELQKTDPNISMTYQINGLTMNGIPMVREGNSGGAPLWNPTGSGFWKRPETIEGLDKLKPGTYPVKLELEGNVYDKNDPNKFLEHWELEINEEIKLTQLVFLDMGISQTSADFNNLTIEISSTWLLNPNPVFNINGNGVVNFSVGSGSNNPELYKTTFYLRQRDLDSLNWLLENTNWLTAPRASIDPFLEDGMRVDMTLDRKGETKKVSCYGNQPEAYGILIDFIMRLYTQEDLLKKLTIGSDSEKVNVAYQLRSKLQEAKDEKVAAGQRILDYNRFKPICGEIISDTNKYNREVIVAALEILGYVRDDTQLANIQFLTKAKQRASDPSLSDEKTTRVRVAAIKAFTEIASFESSYPITELVENYEQNNRQINDAIVEALFKFNFLGSTIDLLKTMLNTTRSAGWALIRLGEPAVPAIVNILQETKPAPAENMNQIYLIRQYIDNWENVPKPVDERVVNAVRENLNKRERGDTWTQYHREFLNLVNASKSENPSVRQDAEQILAETSQATELVPLEINVPPMGHIDMIDHTRIPNMEKYKIRPDFMVPKGTKNVALNKKVTTSVKEPIVIGDLSMITDGIKEDSPGDNVLVELKFGLQHITIDLEKQYNLHAILIWHFFAMNPVYYDVIVQVSNDPNFENDVVTLFNNDHDNSAGLGIGNDKNYAEMPEGKLVDAKNTKARYVRLYSNGASNHEWNHYVEVEVYGTPIDSESSDNHIQGENSINNFLFIRKNES